MEKFKPMKKTGGITEYLSKMKKMGVVSGKETKDILADNDGKNKQERLRKYGLPVFVTWGPTESFTETVKLIPDEWKKIPSTNRFLVRCAPKNSDKNLKLERTMNLTWPEVETFVKGLPGGDKNYTVEIREDWSADYSGTIIANGKGKILSEIITGGLSGIEDKDSTNIQTAQFDSSNMDLHIRYSENMSEEQKRIFIEALKYFIPEVTRENLENLKIYAEFAFSKEHGFRFFEATDKDFWTNI